MLCNIYYMKDKKNKSIVSCLAQAKIEIFWTNFQVLFNLIQFHFFNSIIFKYILF